MIGGRLEDPRLIAILEGLSPLVPRGPLCLSCPPFQVSILDGKTKRRMFTTSAAELGLEKGEWAAATVCAVLDIDGDRVDDVVIGVPLARGEGGLAKAGMLVFMSGKTGMTLARIRGRKAGALLGYDLGIRDKNVLVASAPGEKSAHASVYMIDLQNFKSDRGFQNLAATRRASWN